MRCFFFVLGLLLSLASSRVFASDEGFHDESEVGAAIVSGNTSSETYNVKQSNIYGWDKNIFKLAFRYLNTRSTSGTGPSQTSLNDTARSWDGSLRFERVLSDSFNVFTSYGLESDIFNGYVQRNNFDLGGKYFLAKSDETTWVVEAGYRNIATHYPSSQTDTNTSNLRLYSEATQALSKAATFKIFVEYVQALASNLTASNYSVGQDYQFNVEPSVTAVISQVFSLKATYLFKYMNYIPATSTATKYLDTIFTTSLVAKF